MYHICLSPGETPFRNCFSDFDSETKFVSHEGLVWGKSGLRIKILETMISSIVSKNRTTKFRNVTFWLHFLKSWENIGIKQKKGGLKRITTAPMVHMWRILVRVILNDLSEP